MRPQLIRIAAVIRARTAAPLRGPFKQAERLYAA
jgi:hypothetical protein